MKAVFVPKNNVILLYDIEIAGRHVGKYVDDDGKNGFLTIIFKNENPEIFNELAKIIKKGILTPRSTWTASYYTNHLEAKDTDILLLAYEIGTIHLEVFT